MEKPDWAEQKARLAAMALPPSDFGSHRAIQAVAALLREERAAPPGSRETALREAVVAWFAYFDDDTTNPNDAKFFLEQMRAAIALPTQEAHTSPEAALHQIIEMIVTCHDAPTDPWSLPQAILHTARTALKE